MDKFLVSDIQEDDLQELFLLANTVVEQYVFPTLTEEGQLTLRNSLNKETIDLLNKDLYQALKVMLDGRIVAYVAWRHDYHIVHLYVTSDFQGYGIGSLLVNEVIKRTRSPNLKVRASINAVRFYTKKGFVAAGPESEINGIRFLPMEYNKRT